jgi:hypothetical protein
MSLRNWAIAAQVPALAPGMAFSQCTPKTNTQPESKPVLLTTLPEELIETVKRDFRDCLPNNPEAINQAIRITHLNLGDDNQPAFQIQGINQCSGANNSPMRVYVRLDGSWQKVYDAVGQRLNVLLRRSKGLFDLERWMHGSAFDSSRYVYQFDGHVYGSVTCNVVRFGDILTGKEYPKPRYESCD